MEPFIKGHGRTTFNDPLGLAVKPVTKTRSSQRQHGLHVPSMFPLCQSQSDEGPAIVPAQPRAGALCWQLDATHPAWRKAKACLISSRCFLFLMYVNTNKMQLLHSVLGWLSRAARLAVCVWEILALSYLHIFILKEQKGTVSFFSIIFELVKICPLFLCLFFVHQPLPTRDQPSKQNPSHHHSSSLLTTLQPSHILRLAAAQTIHTLPLESSRSNTTGSFSFQACQLLNLE